MTPEEQEALLAKAGELVEDYEGGEFLPSVYFPYQLARLALSQADTIAQQAARIKVDTDTIKHLQEINEAHGERIKELEDDNTNLGQSKYRLTTIVGEKNRRLADAQRRIEELEECVTSIESMGLVLKKNYSGTAGDYGRKIWNMAQALKGKADK